MTSSEPKNKKPEQLSLSKESWLGDTFYLYQGFWCFDLLFEAIVAFQSHFKAQDSDIILASLPKSGTTWLKSLLYTVVNRQELSSISQHTLQTKNPHELVKFLEVRHDSNPSHDDDHDQPIPTDLTEIPSPRLLATHTPYPSLPDSIKTSECRIIYVCRNPLDTFVSTWNFTLQFDKNKGIEPDVKLMEEHLGKYCRGMSPFGPQDDHILGYWKESTKNPHKVLFLEYEGLKKEPKSHLKKLAEFVGCPFSKEEAEGNVIDQIIDVCSLKSLKEMEINTKRRIFPGVENKFLFRKGEVGDWTNFLTPSMAKQFEPMLHKLKDAGFSFKYSPMNVFM